jgi:hypothetical protein
MIRRHDPFLKLLYRAGARDAVTLFFPDLAHRIDWGQLKWVEKEIPILGQSPRSIVADLVGLTRDTEGRNLEILIHPEIQMKAAADMGWRVLQYHAGLLLQQANPSARVLTIVFYHCRGTGGIREQNHRLEFGGRSMLEVGYWSVGLGDLDAAKYAESQNPIAWALASWMRQQRHGRAELRLSLLTRILRFVRDEPYRWLLLDAVRTYFKLGPAERLEEQQLLRSGRYREVEEMTQTELGKLADAARREGAREALQGALWTIVTTRFSSVPESIEARIQAVQSVATLNRLIRRAASAKTLEELLPALDSGPTSS